MGTIWNKSFYHQLDSSGINKEFYKNIVCTCQELTKPGNHVAEDIGYFRNHELQQQGIFTPIVMKCGKIGYGPLEICDSCNAVFYSSFFHPNQCSIDFDRIHWGTGRYFRYCWHCLENGIHGAWSDFYSKIPKTPPLPELLNPYIKPITVLDRAAEVESKVSQLDAMLKEIEGALLEYRQPK